MKTFVQQRKEDKLKIMVLAPMMKSDVKNELVCIVNKTVKIIKEKKLPYDLTKHSLWALITSSYTMSKRDESELLEVLSYMGYN